MINKKTLLSIGVILVSFSACRAQAVGERITKTTVALYNTSSNELSILLGKTSKMDTFKLRTNEVWFSPTYNFNPVIKVKTKQHITTYQLKLGNYYMIYWNERKKYWDVKKTEKR